MLSAKVLLMVLGLVLLILAGLNVGVPRVNLGWLGLACWLLAVILV